MQGLFFFVLALVAPCPNWWSRAATGNLGELPWGKEERSRAITTLFPLYDFARTIGQDRWRSCSSTPGVEAHSFEPKPSDMVKISGADLFIYTGRFMEPWVETVLKGVTNPKLKVVDASVGIPLLTAESEAHDHGPRDRQDVPAAKGKTQEDGRQRLGQTDVDPHIWLDLGNAAKMVETIAAGLTEVDPPTGISTQRTRKNTGSSWLPSMPGSGTSFPGVRNESSFTAGISPSLSCQTLQPDIYRRSRLYPRLPALAETVDGPVKQIKEHGLKYVYYEELMEPRVAKTLSRETGAALLMLHGPTM